jgi:protein SCO1/2
MRAPWESTPTPSLIVTRAHGILLAVLALAAAALGAWWAAHSLAPRERSMTLTSGTLLAPPQEVGSLDLVDQTGKPFTGARLAGRWSVVYFGFTSCPMVCPTTMALLRDFAHEVRSLPPEVRPQVILITVDPEHDTPQVMGEYVAKFDPGFLGLAGSSAALDAAAAKFDVVHGKLGGDGSIDHSSTIYLVDPEARLSAVFTPPQTAAGLAADYRRLVGIPAGS